MVADGITRIFHVDFKKLCPSVQYCFKEDSTQRIFRMDDDEVEFRDIGDRDSEDDELEVKRSRMKILKSDLEKVKPVLRNSKIQWLDT